MAKSSGGGLEDNIPVNFSNYLAVIDLSNNINAVHSSSRHYYIVVADPDGNILQTVDLADINSNTLKLVPPGKLPSSGAPSSFSVTNVIVFPGGFLDMGTFGGFQPWTTHLTWFAHKQNQSSGNFAGQSSSNLTKFKITLNNLPTGQDHFSFLSANKDYQNKFDSPSSFSQKLQFKDNTKDLVIRTLPNPANYPPLYYWEDNLAQDAPLTLDVSSDFQAMDAHDISLPSGISNLQVFFDVSQDPNTFDFDSSVGPVVVQNSPSGQTLTMYIPGLNHSYYTVITAIGSGPKHPTFYQKAKDLPNTFDLLDYSVDIVHGSLDNFKVSFSGSETPDAIAYLRLPAGPDVQDRWWTVMPPTMDHWVYPKLADSGLPSSVKSKFNRTVYSSESLITLAIFDLPDLNGYRDFVDTWYKPLFGYFSLGLGIGKYRFINPSNIPESINIKKKRTPQGIELLTNGKSLNLR